MSQKHPSQPPDSVEQRERWQQGFPVRKIWPAQDQDDGEDELEDLYEITDEDLIDDDVTLPTGAQFINI